MRKIYTTVSKDYVSDWGFKEGVREIMQNALDSQDKGFQMGVDYVRNKRQLLIYNRGAKLEKSSLLLGTTSKGGDNEQRGSHGEGFKTGSLALVRKGHEVRIHNADEEWECSIDSHPDFKVPVLSFGLSKRNIFKSKDKLIFEISNVEPDVWRDIGIDFLSIFSPDKKTIKETPEGRVLMHKDLKGRIYSGGIYVTTDKGLVYGYDFNPSALRLNRDRNVVDSFNLRWNTSKMWAYLSANVKGKLYDANSMLKKGSPDVEYMSEFADYTVKGRIVEKFFEENSSKSYPVTNKEEETRVRATGHTPVYSTSSYSSCVREHVGSIEDLERKIETDYKLFRRMTSIDDANLKWVFEAMFSIDHEFELDIVVVQFAVSTTKSTSEGNKLHINSNLLGDKYEMLHEAIRHYSNKEAKTATKVWQKLYRETAEGIATDLE